MHEPVLRDEVIELLRVRRGGFYVDATAGSGGHTMAILDAAGPEGRVLAIDRDRDALERVRLRLGARVAQCVLARGNYADVADLAACAGARRVDGMLIDCGVSSEQLETASRGFSFAADGPLDMRMNTDETERAADVVNEMPERDLLFLLKTMGEEPAARRIAHAIVAARQVAPITTTRQLAEIVERAVGGRRGRTHPATRTFQALRMRVNRELESLDCALEAGLNLLAGDGRLAVISFHSLEDRRVKECFRRHAGRWEGLQAGGLAWHGQKPVVRIVTRKPVTPSDAELARNPRARSAKLRVAEKTDQKFET